MRQVGSVLGSASMAALMSSRLSADMPSAAARAADADVLSLPPALHGPYAQAMSQSMLLPAFAALFGVAAAAFLVGSGRTGVPVPAAAR